MFLTITDWDMGILHWIAQHLTNPFLDWFFPLITVLGDAGLFWIALSVLFICIPRTRKMGWTMGVAMLIGLILGNGLLKNVIGRMRPWEFDPTLIPRITKLPTDRSFPSGHTLASFEAATGMFLRNRKWSVPAIILAILIAVSRLYIGVHYPTDVIAGVILGVLFAFAARWIVDRIYAFLEQRRQRTPQSQETTK